MGQNLEPNLHSAVTRCVLRTSTPTAILARKTLQTISVESILLASVVRKAHLKRLARQQAPQHRTHMAAEALLR